MGMKEGKQEGKQEMPAVFSLGDLVGGVILNWNKEHVCGENYSWYYKVFWLSEAKLTYYFMKIILNYIIICMSVKPG